VGHRADARRDGENEVRRRGRDVHREAEQRDEGGHVNEAAADAEEAGREADHE